MRYGRFGGPISVWVSNYVCVATWKSEVRLTSCPLVKSLSVFLVLKVAGPTGGQIRWPHLRSDWRPRWANEIPFVKGVKVAVVQTGSLLSFSITSLVQLTRMGSLAGFLDNSKSLLGIAAGLGLARHFRVPVRTRSWFLWSAHRSVTFWKNRPDDGVKWGHWSHL